MSKKLLIERQFRTGSLKVSRGIIRMAGIFFCCLIVQSGFSQQQSIRVRGSVTSEEGEQLPGVNVVVKGTSHGTVTDTQGIYSIDVAENATLVFSFIGYENREVQVNGRSQINLNLVESVTNLDEVVVVGYGTVKKSDLTGSVSSLKLDEIETGNTNSLEKQLSGRVSGTQVITNSGEPGAGTTIRIRGVNSILGNNGPLFVIDGIPYGNTLGPEINPGDIASIEILKDASATAIFGSRGANGVILITSKKGKEGRPQINFSTYYGQSVVTDELKLLNAEQLAQIHKRAIENGVTEAYDPDGVNGAGTDWQDEVFRKASAQNYQLNVSGGTPDITYMFSGNYLNEEGIVINSNYERYSLRSNIDTKVNERLNLGINLFASKSQQNGTQPGGRRAGVIGAALRANPIFPVKDDNGNYTVTTDPLGKTANPVANALLEVRENNMEKLLFNIHGEYKISENLTATIRFGENITNSRGNFFSPKQAWSGISNKGIANINNINRSDWTSNNTLTYNKSFNENQLNAMVGFIAEKSKIETSGGQGTNFQTDYQRYHSLQSAQNQSANSSLLETQLASFMGRINYNFRDKYLFTLSGRYDGSSKFANNNKWAFFPSGAFAWKVSNESFMKSLELINSLKVRVSIGTVGEQAISSYQTLQSLSPVVALTAGDEYRIGFAPDRLANANLKWERTHQANIGMDAELWQSRVTLNIDFYYKKTTDLLYQKAIPQTSGFSSVFDNIGEMENKGMDFSMRSVNTTGAFLWSTDFNFSLNRNRILDLGLNPDGSNINRIVSPVGGVGEPAGLPPMYALIRNESIGGAYGWVFEGTYKSLEEVAAGPEPGSLPGDPRYKDLDGDGDVDGDDRKFISKPYPDFYGGINNEISFKNFDLSVFFQYSLGNELFNLNHQHFAYLDGINNTEQWALNYWSPENSQSNIPRPGWDARTNAISTFHVEDASFLRAKNITFGYSFPIEKLGRNISSLRVYFSVDNAFTITNYSGYNPDVSAFGSSAISSGFDESTYPLAKTFLFGVNIKL